jgi:hypothetical protein
MTSIAFTRYLYEKTEVLHSLLFALLNRNRNEALFWAYELFFSGFEEELAQWIRWIYATFYSCIDKWFYEFMEIHLSRLKSLSIKEERDCIIGTVISNLAHRDYDIQTFVSQYMNLAFEYQKPEICNHRIYIQFRSRDLAKYLTRTLGIPTSSRTYLQTVVSYPIRKSESIFMQKYVRTSSITFEDKSSSVIPQTPTKLLRRFSGVLTKSDIKEDTKDPYLYNWLYYAAQSPIWNSRIVEYGGIVDDTKRLVLFPDDDQHEAFYEKYGFEPDEQSEEIHLMQGVDVHDRGVFGEQCPHEFIASYSNGKIERYSQK